MGSGCARVALALLLAAPDARAACDAPTRLADLEQTVRDAEAAVQVSDSALFPPIAARALAQLECLDVPLTPVHAASYHRVRAFDAFLARDHAATTLHFQAVLAIQPGYVLPDALTPGGEAHPLRQWFNDAASFEKGTTFPLDPPVSGHLLVDGDRVPAVPSGRPWILQHVDSLGNVTFTKYVAVGEPVPAYPVAAPLVAPPKRRGPAPAVALLAGGAAALGTGVWLYADMQGAANRNFPELNNGDQEDYWRRTLRPRYLAGVTLMGVGGAALGGGGLLLLVGDQGSGVRGRF